jgi:hypothetical protein
MFPPISRYFALKTWLPWRADLDQAACISIKVSAKKSFNFLGVNFLE